MSQLNPSFAHGNLPYYVHPEIYGPRRQRSAWPKILRDVMLGVFLGGAVIIASFAWQARQPDALANAPPSPPRIIPSTSLSGQAGNSAPAAVIQPSQPDSAALQTVLDKWQSDYKKAQLSVVVKELGGQERKASLNPNTQFNAASLYKLYLEDYLYKKVEQGKLSLAKPLGSPRTLADCLNRMIIYSDNACGDGIGYTVGWTNVNNFMQSSGFSGSSLDPANIATASDIAKYLEELQNGSLLNPQFTAQLLNNMKNQVYRSAIPAGVPGVAVADKTGDIADYWHDAAIVYHPKGTYILVVMTKGAGTAPIKDLSQRVSAFMNQ